MDWQSRRRCSRWAFCILVLLGPGDWLPRQATGPVLAQAADPRQSTSTQRIAFTEANVNQAVQDFVDLVDSSYDTTPFLRIPNELQQAIDGAKAAAANATSGSKAAAAGAAAGTAGNKTLTPEQRVSAGLDLIGGAIGQYMQELLKVAANPSLRQQRQQEFINVAKNGTKLSSGRRLHASQPVGGDGSGDAEYLDEDDQAILDHLMAMLDMMADGDADAASSEQQWASGEEGDFEEGDFGEGDAEGAAPGGQSRRKLQQQVGGSGVFYNGYANAFRLIWSNAFDFLLRGGAYYFAPYLSNLGTILTNFNWIRQLADTLDAPLDNLINTNYFPLPQSNDDATALILRWLSPFCSQEEVGSSGQVLFSYVGPTYSVTLNPWSCPIVRDPITGIPYVNTTACDPSTLEIATTPVVITEPYLTAATYTSASCNYVFTYGTNFVYNLGGGDQEFTFTESTQGITIDPVLNEFNLAGVYAPYQPYPVNYTTVPDDATFGGPYYYGDYAPLAYDDGGLATASTDAPVTATDATATAADATTTASDAATEMPAADEAAATADDTAPADDTAAADAAPSVEAAAGP